MSRFTIAYTDEYMDWQFGAGTRATPRRAEIAVAKLAGWALMADVRLQRVVPRLDWAVIEAQGARARVHDPDYLRRVRSGS